MRVPLTEEFLQKFGRGDQFRLFFPETGDMLIASITAMSFVHGGEGGQELLVEFEDAVVLGDGGSSPAPDITRYDGAPTENLFISKEEDGYALVPNIPGEQILLFFKPTHQGYIRVEKRAT